MPPETKEILDFFKDSMWMIVIIVGAFCVFMAVFLFSRVYQWESSLGFLFGVTLMIVGSALHFESFEWKLPSLGGFGTILIYVSPLLMAAAVVTAIFAVPGKLVGLPMYFGRDEHGLPFVNPKPGDPQIIALIMLIVDYPYAWLATPLILAGLGLLAFGCLLKFASDIF